MNYSLLVVRGGYLAVPKKKRASNGIRLFYMYKSMRINRKIMCLLAFFGGVSTFSLRAQNAVIKNVWIETDVIQEQKKGIVVHVDFIVSGKKGETISCIALFYDDNKKRLTSNSVGYKTTNNTLHVLKKSVSKYENCHWTDLKMFVPYDVMDLRWGTSTYYCKVFISGSDFKMLVASDYFDFTISTSATSSRSSSSNGGLLYERSYTISKIGYCPDTGTYLNASMDMQVDVKIYNDYILVFNARYDYMETSNGWRVYGGKNYNHCYEVNFENFDMRYCSTLSNYFGTFTVRQTMTKDIVPPAIYPGNSYVDESEYVGGGGDYSIGTSSGSSSSRTCTKISVSDIAHCNGSGVCSKCNGKGQYYDTSYGYSRWVDPCITCGGSGKCPSCGGTGRR